MSSIEALLRDVDTRWPAVHGASRILLRILGQSALFLQTGYDRGTRDGDILETLEVSGTVRSRLERLAGQGTRLAIRHGMYLDVVGAAIPMLPAQPLWHSYPMDLANFDVVVLDVADVLVSKLKRFSADDRDDVRAMIDGEHVQHEVLQERFLDLIKRHQFQARGADLPVMVERFNQIERDLFLVPETEFKLHRSVYR